MVPIASAPPTDSVFRRFLKFGTVGASGVVVNLIILTFLVQKLGWHHLLAALVSIEASTLTNYALNRAWTWRDRAAGGWGILSYHTVTALGMSVQWLSLWILTDALAIDYRLASVLGVILATGWNFAANHRLTFAEHAPERAAQRRRFVLYAAAIVLHVGLAALLTHDWDTFVFQTSARQFLTEGITPYETGLEKPDYTYWGIGLPLQTLWYAYPPLPLLLMSATFGPVVAGWATQPWLGRVLIKLPFIIAHLGLAYVARRFVMTAEGSPDVIKRNADKIEAFFLFNPLFVFVVTVWGMFEGLMLLFLCLTFFALRNQRWGLAGSGWGAALLLKLFPIYLAPVLLFWLVRRGGVRAAFTFFAVGGGVFAILSLPFFLLEPHGFIEQVLLMHAGRAPGRFAPIALAYEALRMASRRWPGTLPEDAELASAAGLFSFVATAIILVLLAIASLRSPANERSLIRWSALSLMGGLLSTKVLAEQYILLPLGLLAIYHLHPTTETAGLAPRPVRRVILSISLFVFIAGLLDNIHFLLFIPDDVAKVVLGVAVPQAVFHTANAFGLTVSQFHLILGVIGGFGLAVPFFFCLRLLGPALAMGFTTITTYVHEGVEAQRRGHPRMVRAFLVGFLVLILLPGIALGALAPKREGPPPGAGSIEDGPVIFAHYRTNWFNPQIWPTVPGGSWPASQFTPASGYYNTISHKASEDLTRLRGVGVDAVIIAFHPAFERDAGAVAVVSDDLQMPHTIEVDLLTLANEDGTVPISREGAEAARELFNGPGLAYWDYGYHLRLGATRGPVVFLAGADLVQPTFSDAERRFVASMLEELLDEESLAEIREDGMALWQQAPADAHELAAPDAAVWRQAYNAARLHWWTIALGTFGPSATQPPVELILDAPIDLDVTKAAHVVPVAFYQPVRALHNATPSAEWGLPLVATVDASPADPATFERTFSESQSALAVQVPWNDFDLGQGMEPTLEHGDVLLARLLAFTHAQPLPAPAPLAKGTA